MQQLALTRHPIRLTSIGLTTLVAAGLIAAPVLVALLTGFFTGGGETWSHIVSTQLLGYTWQTLVVLFFTTLLILLFAVPTAWFVSLYDFPGRKVFEWALILPLAAPGYVLSYAWADITNVAGPVQSLLRDMTGLSARDYWFPSLYGAPGLSFVMACALFPYAYLTARAAFSNLSLCTIEAARSLGASPARIFFQVALPAARPAIFAGLALALMETAADYGAASYLGVQTLSVGIFRAWHSFSEPAVAARLAFLLILIAFGLQFIERAARGRGGTQQTATRWRTPRRRTLDRRTGLLVTAGCTAVLLLAFIFPVSRLIWVSAETGLGHGQILRPFLNSLTLAFAGSVLAFVLALTVVIGARQNRFSQLIGRIAAGAGYAAPGIVLALGALFILSWTSFSVAGPAALVFLVWIYASRFTAAGAEPLSAAFSRAPASLGNAARSLGANRFQRLIRVDLPVAMSGAAAASIILFVEMLKELPATLMLRPFNWDTLAVQAHAYAIDERLAAATLPSLLITAAGLGPVILLSLQLTKAGESRAAG
ncbi:ABC transporter permease [Henriciella aquimarina]|uniref:ABC transporter permease n=1 Tax=Henriciella aquimarina TaxID=545261 RepID=UPI0009FE0F81|nr:iron ABC transporter permease [Henriciella aquimarina]